MDIKCAYILNDCAFHPLLLLIILLETRANYNTKKFGKGTSVILSCVSNQGSENLQKDSLN